MVGQVLFCKIGRLTWLVRLLLCLAGAPSLEAAIRPHPPEDSEDPPLIPSPPPAPPGIPGTDESSANAPVWNLPLAPGFPEWRWEDALGDLTFEEPTAVVAPPGETNRLFVLERTGWIQVVTNLAAPNRTPFLDLRPNLYASYLEAGALALAFHPGYATNRQFFVLRTVAEIDPEGTTNLFLVLARFETSADDPNQADPLSEVRLISQKDGSDAHNGGDLKFGPDGYLYVSLGDETPPAEQHDGNRQPLTTFFGAILRIDVDRRPGNLPPPPHPGVSGDYSVPRDNPFVGATRVAGRDVVPGTMRTEFYALGLRNPWRMAFDPERGDLWVGEVGASRFEEVNRLRPGGNYGWPYREGHADGIHWFLAPPDLAFDPPIWVYEHGFATNQGNAVVAGLFYRGERLPGLRGRFVYGDCRSGHTWALDHGTGGAIGEPRWLCTEPGLVTYVEDPRDREILAANFRTGRIRKLVAPTVDPGPTLPSRLSATGIFTDLATLTPNPRLRAYRINAPFWSDHAEKWRWVSVPDGAEPWVREDGVFDFPSGTVWVKHFELELTQGLAASRRRLETRLVVRTEAGAYGATYRWNDSQEDAELVPAEGFDESFTIRDGSLVRTQVWHYPGRAECLACHTRAAGYAVGFSAEQLNLTLAEDGQAVPQIERLQGWGVIPPDLPPASELPALVSPQDFRKPLEQRVRSYLASNCSGCHRPGELLDTGARWDARHSVTLAETGLLDGRLCVPGSPVDSRLFRLVEWTSVDLRMPPLSTHVRNDIAVSLLAEWINALPRPPWYREDVGESAGSAPGYATLDLARRRATVSGAGSATAADRAGFHFLHRVLQGDGLLEGTLILLDGARPDGLAGVGLGPWLGNEASAGLGLRVGLDGSGRLRQWFRSEAGEVEDQAGAAVSGAVRLRIARSGGTLTSEMGAEGRPTRLAIRQAEDPDAIYELGLFSGSGDDRQPAHAWFQDLRWAEVSWVTPGANATLGPQQSVPLEVAVVAEGLSVGRVEFLAGDQVIATCQSAPYRADWINPPAGLHALTARVVWESGGQLTTRPRPLQVAADPPRARFRAMDFERQGNWVGHFGALGYRVAGEEPGLPDGSGLQLGPAAGLTWGDATTDVRALERPDRQGRTSAAWVASETLELHVQPPDPRAYVLTAYFLDWNGSDRRSQRVDLVDPTSDTPLDSQVIDQFSGGVYLSWVVRGAVRLRIEGLGPDFQSAVLSGVFLDRLPEGAGQARLAEPVAGAHHRAPEPLRLRAEPVNPAGPPERVEFLVDGVVVTEARGPEFTGIWEKPLAGTRRVTVRAWDETEHPWETSPVEVVIDLPSAEAEFLGYELSAKGDWPRRLGSEGRLVAPGHVSLPPQVRVEWRQAKPFYWVNPSSQFVTDPRAPRIAADDRREAACWYEHELVAMDVDFLDGESHVLSIYCVDWDTNLRRQRIEILEQGSERILATTTVADLFPGVYAGFRARGSVRVQIWGEAVNAVVSAVLIDPFPGVGGGRATFEELSLTAAGWGLQWSAPPGGLYRVATTDALGQGWTVAPMIVTSADGRYRHVEGPTAGEGSGARFYRLELLSTGRLEEGSEESGP